MFFISLFNLSIQSWHAFELVSVFFYYLTYLSCDLFPSKTPPVTHSQIDTEHSVSTIVYFVEILAQNVSLWQKHKAMVYKVNYEQECLI